MPHVEKRISNVEMLVVFAVLVVLLYQVPQVRLGTHALYEDTALFLSPSAERAYVYGAKHFDALAYPGVYDVARAQSLFEKTLELDPVYPYTHHQLGRIAFLRGDYVTALRHIDEELTLNLEPSPSTYYVRGLILGFMGRYDEAAKGFERFLAVTPENWAALNDYAWVLLKAGRIEEAAVAAEKGLVFAPDNPWLLNSAAIALYETGEVSQALVRARAAAEAAARVTEEEWLRAYPGNDPQLAGEGVASFQKSTLENIHTIETANAEEGIY